MDDRIAHRLQAAASQPRIPDDHAHQQIERRGNRKRRQRRGSVSLLSILVAVAAVLVWPGPFGDTVVVTSPPQTPTEFALPAQGQTHAVEHPDGTPLFVVHTDTSEVHVLSAVSAHLDHLVVWCPQEEIFVEPIGASVFDPDGAWRGGAAPHGLASYPHQVLEQDGEPVVRVADDPQQPSQPPDDTEIPARASTCFDRAVVNEPEDITTTNDEILLPTPFTTTPLTADELSSVPPGKVVVVEATLDLDDTTTLCSAARADCADTDDTLPVESSWSNPQGPLADYEGATRGTFLVRVTDTGIQDLAQLRRDTEQPEDIYLHDLRPRDD